MNSPYESLIFHPFIVLFTLFVSEEKIEWTVFLMTEVENVLLLNNNSYNFQIEVNQLK